MLTRRRQTPLSEVADLRSYSTGVLLLAASPVLSLQNLANQHRPALLQAPVNHIRRGSELKTNWWRNSKQVPRAHSALSFARCRALGGIMDPSRYFVKAGISAQLPFTSFIAHVDVEMSASIPQRNSAIWLDMLCAFWGMEISRTLCICLAPRLPPALLEQDAPARPTMPSEMALRWQLCTTSPSQPSRNALPCGRLLFYLSNRVLERFFTTTGY